jgi:hypothetical protein
VPSLGSLIEEESDVEDRDLERALFGSDVAAEIAGIICEFARDQLAPVNDAVFYRRSVGIVAGLRTADGHGVVVKVHRWQVSISRLLAVQRVQAHLSACGLPVPRPLCPPMALGSGLAVVEELRNGALADGHDGPIRRALAAGLCRLVVAAEPLGLIADLGSPVLLRPPGAPLWPEPHDLRFDFAATAAGAEWIDDLARLARDRLAAVMGARTGEPVIGHLDWRVSNVGFEGGRITAIYDWDSVAMAPEAFFVGAAAAQFSADWASGAGLPSVEEMRAFVAEYEESRGRRFDAGERELLDAANLAACAYAARCQHSDIKLGRASARPSSADSIRLLRQRASEALTS